MKVLLVGDIVGKPGRALFTQLVGELRASGAVDFVIANGENAASGRGPTPEITQALIAAGADVIILGDHTWDSKEMVAGIDLEERVIRPANFPKEAPGKGWVRVETPEGPIAVMQVIGRVFMQPHQSCPFTTAIGSSKENWQTIKPSLWTSMPRRPQRRWLWALLGWTRYLRYRYAYPLPNLRCAHLSQRNGVYDRPRYDRTTRFGVGS